MSPSLTAPQILGIDEQHLCQIAAVSAQRTGPKGNGAVSAQHRLTAAAANAFLSMQAAAASDGIDVQIISGYRSFAQQRGIWQAKWQGQRPILNDDDQPINTAELTDIQRIHAILRWSAIPGGSRHHWGTDIDVYCAAAVTAANHRLALIASEYAPDGICGEMTAWLAAHAHEYGFARPYANDHGGIGIEPWHYSYTPQADAVLQSFPLSDLHQLLLESDIGGKITVLHHLPHIFARYIRNNH